MTGNVGSGFAAGQRAGGDQPDSRGGTAERGDAETFRSASEEGESEADERCGASAHLPQQENRTLPLPPGTTPVPPDPRCPPPGTKNRGSGQAGGGEAAQANPSNSGGDPGGAPRGPVAKKRRIMKPDANRKAPKMWAEEEIALFKKMVEEEGPVRWEAKAQRLGTGRTAKALHTRWMRDQGRIVDKPRARPSASERRVRERELAAQAAAMQAAAAAQSAEAEAGAAQAALAGMSAGGTPRPVNAPPHPATAPPLPARAPPPASAPRSGPEESSRAPEPVAVPRPVEQMQDPQTKAEPSVKDEDTGGAASLVSDASSEISVLREQSSVLREQAQAPTAKASPLQNQSPCGSPGEPPEASSQPVTLFPAPDSPVRREQEGFEAIWP